MYKKFRRYHKFLVLNLVNNELLSIKQDVDRNRTLKLEDDFKLSSDFLESELLDLKEIFTQKKERPIAIAEQNKELFIQFAKFAKDYRSNKKVETAFEQWLKKLK